MTGNRVLLDTNIVIELFKGESQILVYLEKQEIVYLPFAALGELLLGAYRSANTEKKLNEIKKFLSECNVLKADEATADKYARVKTGLLSKGKPIPENDIWIAAIALQFDLPLYSNDKHFEEVDGIILI